MTYFYEARMTEKHIALMTHSKERQNDIKTYCFNDIF